MENRKSTWIRAIVLAVSCLIIGVIFLVVMLSSTSDATEEKQIEVRAYVEEKAVYTLENDELKFEMDAATTHFTVTQKSTGEVWYSNPVEADEDTVALTEDKNNLKSTAIITYSNENGVDTLFNNYSYSINRGIYEIEEGDDYIKVKYSLGNTSKVFTIPLAVPESRMNELMQNMEKSSQKQVKEYYKKYDIKKLKKTDNKEELLATYPDLANECVYVLRDGLADHIKEKLETAFASIHYSYEDYQADLARYSTETSSKTIIFNLSMIYRLDGDDLIVEVPMEEIEYPATNPLTEINVLPYMGAGSTQENGYLFVPEGGGSIIRFNNGRLSSNPYYANVYGWDYASSRSEVIHETKTEYPVFGIAKNGASFLCILEDGASYASILADISGRYNNYNSVSASFTTLHSEAYDVSEKSNAAVYVYEKQMPNENLVQRYHFMDSERYVDMAMAYRDYMLEQYPSLVKKEETSTPVAVEIVGAIDKVQQKMGLPVSLPVPLTTYKEAKSMIEQLKNDGFTNLLVKYTGWMNGGVNQRLLKDVDLISDLGSKKEFKSLVAYTNENNIPLYLDGVVQMAYDSDVWDGFLAFRDAARFTSQEEAEVYHYDPVFYGEQKWLDPYFVLTPALTKLMTKNLANEVEQYEAYGVSLRDTGDILSADYNKKKLVSREESKKLQVDSVKSIRDSGLGVMINSGNSYVAGYADFITNMDLSGAEYSIIDETIPFYQLVLHGYVNYSGEAINLAGDYEEAILQSAEAGACLQFVFMQEEATKLQNTLYSQYFGADFSAWEAQAVEIYQEYNDKLGHIFSQTITDHYKVSDYVTATVYEDGTTVYVNYGLKDYNTDGVTVPARSYITKGGK